MDPSKNPVDPNRFKKLAHGSKKRIPGSARPSSASTSALVSSTVSVSVPVPAPLAPVPSADALLMNLHSTEHSFSHDDLDHGESLLADMASEFTPLRSSVVEAEIPKFDIGSLNTVDAQPNANARHYDERDFQSHRREGFAQTHQPLRPIHSSRTGKRKTPGPGTPSRMGTGTSTEFHDTLIISQSEGQIISGPAASQIDVIEEEEVPESWPFLLDPSHSDNVLESRQTGSGYEDFMDSPQKKVQFEVGGSPFHSASEDVEPVPVNPERKKYKVRSQRYEDPLWRVRQGSDVPLLQKQQSHQGPEVELTDMPEHDKDGLSSHRFEDTKNFRRHKFYPKEPDSTGQLGQKMQKYDHRPHEIFVEMDILSGHGPDREWQETARWIKYEEDLEEGADRWGKPHVASLSFHSLINLRRLLEDGVVLMDLEERDLPGVAYRVVDQMGINDLIHADEKATVLRSLLLKHKHVQDGGRGGWNFANRRNTGSLTSLHHFDERNKPKPMSVYNVEPVPFQRRNSSAVARLIRNDSMLGQGVAGRAPQIQNGQNGQSLYPLREFKSTPTHIALDMAKLSSAAMSQEDIRWMSNKDTILRRIPEDAEASIVLVGKDDSLEGPTLAFVRLAESVYMPNITELPIPVRFVFILMGPSSCDLDYKEVGRSISTLMSNPQFHEIAYRADTRKDLLKGIHEFLDESIVLPPGDWDDKLFPFDELKEKTKAIRMRKLKRSTIIKGSGADVPDMRKPPSDKAPPQDDPFKKTRKYFGGLKNDIKRRYSLYWSDIRDGCNIQCLATIIFLYFACVAGAIAFGGLMGKKTDNYIGITETLIGTSIGGIVFALTSAQPLLIVGTTGPLLVFDDSLFQFCRSVGLSGNEFLAIRSWIGLWMVVIGLFVAFFEGSVIVRYFTRFIIEIFATYISLVFIAESLKSLVQIYVDHPLMETYGSCDDGVIVEDLQRRPNVALLATVLMFGTFSIAYFLKEFRNSGYLTKSIRKLLGNFAVLIAIVSMSMLDLFVKNTATDKLDIPDAAREGLKTSVDERDWLVHPFNLKLFWIAASILPAVLLYILVFMETSIAELLIGKKEMKLRKGSGFHLDITLICLVNAVMGFLGTCWISSAIVRAVAHTVALAVYTTNNPPGEKPQIVGVKEQRVTALVVSILMGLSVLMADVLKLIPLSVLFGVFLFMGVSSMSGIQFLDRVKLLFKQVRKHPQVPYVRRVRMRKMHFFTFIQLLSLAFLWGMKESPAALALPLIIILLIPFRLHILKVWFTPMELAVLDAQGLEVEDPPEESVAIAILPSPQKTTRNGGVYHVEENGKSTSINGTVNDFRSI